MRKQKTYMITSSLIRIVLKLSDIYIVQEDADQVVEDIF